MTHRPPPKWQNVTFMGKWPASSGTPGIDGEFTAAQSFKTQPKGQRLVVGSVCACVCVLGCGAVIPAPLTDVKPLGASPAHRLIIGHPSNSPVITSRVPVRWASRPSVYFWSHCRLFVSTLVARRLTFGPAGRNFISGAADSDLGRVSRTHQEAGEAAATQRLCALFYFTGFRIFKWSRRVGSLAGGSDWRRETEWESIIVDISGRDCWQADKGFTTLLEKLWSSLGCFTLSWELNCTCVINETKPNCVTVLLFKGAAERADLKIKTKVSHAEKVSSLRFYFWNAPGLHARTRAHAAQHRLNGIKSRRLFKSQKKA